MKLLFEEGFMGENELHRLYKHNNVTIGIWVQDIDRFSEASRKVVIGLFSNTNMKWENLRTEKYVEIDKIEETIEELLRYVKYIID